VISLRSWRNIKLGIKSLMLHKLRSLLTMLGVVFGVGSVVAMLSVGEGASQAALAEIARLGSRNIIITSVKPSEEQQPSSSTQRSFMSVYGLLYEDETRIRSTYDSVTRTVPAKIIRKEARLNDRSQGIRVVGTTEAWFDLVDRPLVAGRTITQEDVLTQAAVCVLSEQVARDLLAGRQTIGQAIRIGNDYFRVIGIVASEAGVGTSVQTPDHANDAYVPINVARERWGEIFTLRLSGSFIREQVELHQIIVEVDAVENVEPTAQAIEAMLERFHRRTDYQISVPLALLRQARETRRIFNIVLGSIAGISLLVGGIGIMNIMLASVTERTREIGIRRAIGARRSQIIAQFLIETVVLSLVGGLIGVVMGLVIPLIIERLANMPTVVTPWSVVLSLTISAAVGIIFGLYPAVRAANLDPIVALRRE
jgi:putative ABC transport system permease protein